MLYKKLNHLFRHYHSEINQRVALCLEPITHKVPRFLEILKTWNQLPVASPLLSPRPNPFSQTIHPYRNRLLYRFLRKPPPSNPPLSRPKMGTLCLETLLHLLSLRHLYSVVSQQSHLCLRLLRKLQIRSQQSNSKLPVRLIYLKSTWSQAQRSNLLRLHRLMRRRTVLTKDLKY